MFYTFSEEYAFIKNLIFYRTGDIRMLHLLQIYLSQTSGLTLCPLKLVPAISNKLFTLFPNLHRYIGIFNSLPEAQRSYLFRSKWYITSISFGQITWVQITRCYIPVNKNVKTLFYPQTMDHVLVQISWLIKMIWEDKLFTFSAKSRLLSRKIGFDKWEEGEKKLNAANEKILIR